MTLVHYLVASRSSVAHIGHPCAASVKYICTDTTGLIVTLLHVQEQEKLWGFPADSALHSLL